MATTFESWLDALAAAGKGGRRAVLHCDRGVPFSRAIAVQSDLTGAAVRGEVRLTPDAGAALATFTVSPLSVAAGVTTFTLSLSEAVVGALPAASDGSFVVQFAFDLLITLSGGSEQRLLGGIFTVAGQVTA